MKVGETPTIMKGGKATGKNPYGPDIREDSVYNTEQETTEWSRIVP